MDAALLDLLGQLVAIDSTSSRPNAPMIDVLERRLLAAGLTCQRQDYRDAAGTPKLNLVASTGPGLPELSLVGHTDCVPFDAAQWPQALTLTERDGKLFGRGACDTKAFVACAVLAAERTRGQLTRPLQILFTADEELGCFGAKQLVDAGLGHCKRAIIGEPTGLHPIRATKGYCLADVEVHGHEGHSAYPDTGRSAILHAARLLTRLEAYALGPLRKTADPGFSPPWATVNVGVISGGKAKNIIAGSCRFTLEWRPLPGQRVEEVLEALHREIAVLGRELPGFSATVTPLRLDRGFDTNPAEDVVAFLVREVGRGSQTVSFGTEGPQLRALGAQPVVFGPGDITVAHQSGEYVPKEELFAAARAVEAAVRHFCG